MIDETLKQFVEFVRESSPLVWGALIKQVYSEAVGYFAWSIGLAVVAFLLYRVARRVQEDDGDDFVITITWVGVVLAGFPALMLFTSAIQHIINPEFYAIRFLISSLGGG
jgi:hypothetical protein